MVDDGERVLRIVAGVLTTSGYEVLTAIMGDEALQRSRDYMGAIHLLLSDFQMPEMSGVSLQPKSLLTGLRCRFC